MLQRTAAASQSRIAPNASRVSIPVQVNGRCVSGGNAVHDAAASRTLRRIRKKQLASHLCLHSLRPLRDTHGSHRVRLALHSSASQWALRSFLQRPHHPMTPSLQRGVSASARIPDRCVIVTDRAGCVRCSIPLQVVGAVLLAATSAPSHDAVASTALRRVNLAPLRHTRTITRVQCQAPKARRIPVYSCGLKLLDYMDHKPKERPQVEGYKPGRAKQEILASAFTPFWWSPSVVQCSPDSCAHL